MAESYSLNHSTQRAGVGDEPKLLRLDVLPSAPLPAPQYYHRQIFTQESNLKVPLKPVHEYFRLPDSPESSSGTAYVERIARIFGQRKRRPAAESKADTPSDADADASRDKRLRHFKSLSRLHDAGRYAFTRADDTLELCNDFVSGLTKMAPYASRPQEIVDIERVRSISRRYLAAEEEKIRMECTPELVDNVHRRYLATTIGRRNPELDIDVQDLYYRRDGIEKLSSAHSILLASGSELQESLREFYCNI